MALESIVTLEGVPGAPVPWPGFTAGDGTPLTDIKVEAFTADETDNAGSHFIMLEASREVASAIPPQTVSFGGTERGPRDFPDLNTLTIGATSHALRAPLVFRDRDITAPDEYQPDDLAYFPDLVFEFDGTTWATDARAVLDDAGRPVQPPADPGFWEASQVGEAIETRVFGGIPVDLPQRLGALAGSRAFYYGWQLVLHPSDASRNRFKPLNFVYGPPALALAVGGYISDAGVDEPISYTGNAFQQIEADFRSFAGPLFDENHLFRSVVGPGYLRLRFRALAELASPLTADIAKGTAVTLAEGRSVSLWAEFLGEDTEQTIVGTDTAMPATGELRTARWRIRAEALPNIAVGGVLTQHASLTRYSIVSVDRQDSRFAIINASPL